MAYTTINKGSDYFNTVLYTGNSSTQSITGVGFQPDWTWLKCRNDGQEHRLTDAVRGTTKCLETNSNIAEFTTTDTLTSFDSDGFSVGNNPVSNYSGNTQVSWNWLGANGTSANTDGDIASTVSANTTAGFSIVSYTGTGSVGSIGHGLGSTPKMIIKKKRSGADVWNVWHTSIGDGSKALYLNATNAIDTNANYASNVPTSSLFYVGTDSQINASGGTYIAYCFAEKKGYSKFGSYTGNGSTDGTFIYTGFKPAFIMFKDTGYASNWCMFDNRRAGYNSKSDILAPNTNGAEDASNTTFADFLSNGFKWRFTNADFNSSGNNYIYMAFAEASIVGTNNIPANAR